MQSTSPPDTPDTKASFRKPSNDAANRKYSRCSPGNGSSSSDVYLFPVGAGRLPSRMVASMVGASKTFLAGEAVNGVSQNKFFQVVLVSPQSGSDASIVAEVLEVEDNSTQKMLLLWRKYWRWRIIQHKRCEQ